MTNVMKILASVNGWEMVQDLNSVITLHHGSSAFYVESAIEALRNIPDMETRRAMASQIYGGR